MPRRLDKSVLILNKFRLAVSMLFYWEFLMKHRIMQAKHSPYSPDLSAPYDFFLLPLQKIHFKGKIWESVINVLNDQTTIFKKINVSFRDHLCLGKYSFSLDTSGILLMYI